MKRVLVCALLLAWSGMACAVVYRWVDAQGKVHYGDTPPDGVHAEVVDLPGSHATTGVSAPPPAPAAPATARTPPAANADGAKQAVDSDVAESREKQCADAQERYKKLIEARKLYKAGPDGQREYLSSDEIDAQRLAAKQDVDTVCNSPT
jgi:hypothetical protein